MATVVCQGVQCLESLIVEPRTLNLKLSTEVSENCQSFKNSDVGGWSFLQALSNGSQQGPELGKESLYVHPLVKRSASTLSEKSLSLCTENLGNETGTDIIADTESNIFSEFSGDSTEEVNLPQMEEQREKKSGQCLVAKKAKARNFPPPLTTISGRESLQFRPHREGGRLIIKAVQAPSKQSCFQADRSDGRLRLCLLENNAPSFDYRESYINGVENEGKEGDKQKEEDENDSNFEDEEKEEDDNAEEQEGGGIRADVSLPEEEEEEEEEEEMDGNHANVGGEMEIKKYKRPRRGSRCKGCEQEKEPLLNWKALLVATS